MEITASNPLILASASPRRRELLQNIGIVPDEIIAADIDETPKPKEQAKELCQRLAESKAKKIRETHTDCFILAADTVVVRGQKILGKPENEGEAREFLKLLSARRHHVISGMALINPDGKCISRVVDTMVQFKTLTPSIIDYYIKTGEWEGKAGGYGIQDFAATFVKNMQGSHSNVVGLSLYDTIKILQSGGYLATDH
ncbi:MAG: nucleoside triphosphate pyrophosphatase [Pseudomonadota bacterium]